MYVAKDETGKSVAIEHADALKDYFCPACGESLIQRRGNLRAHHFAHHSFSNCCMTAPMTEWHLGWQREFPDEYREVVFKDGDEFRRADIACHDLVVEFQHSSISPETMQERTAFYKKLNKQVWWLFDCEGYAVTDLLENFSIGNGDVHYTGSFVLPDDRFSYVVTNQNDIVILDFHDVCAIMTSWGLSRNSETMKIPAHDCLIVRRDFVVAMISDCYKLKSFDWNLVDYIATEEKRTTRCVEKALYDTFPNVERWKIKNNLKCIGKYVLGMDTNYRNTYPALYYVHPDRRKDTFKWWYPYLDMAQRTNKRNYFKGLQKSLHGNTFAYRWFGDDETLSIRRVGVSLALFHSLMSCRTC